MKLRQRVPVEISRLGSRLKSKQRKAARSQLGCWDTDKSQSWLYPQVSGLISPGSISKALLYSATSPPKRKRPKLKYKKGAGSEILPNLSSAHKEGQRAQGGVEIK